MARKETVYEYIDARGRTRTVGSIDKIPRKFRHTMMAVGPQQENQKSQLSSWLKTNPLTRQTGISAPLALSAVVFTVVFTQAKDFAIKAITGTVAALLIFFALYTWGQKSGYLATSQRDINHWGRQPR